MKRMKRFSRRDFLKAGAATAVGGLLARCGAAASPTAPPEARPTTPAVETPAVLTTPSKEEVTITFAGDADIETLRVDVWGSLLAYSVYRGLYCPLVHYNVEQGADGLLYYVPGDYDFVGAESAEMSPDMTKVTWKIRQGLTFESGKPITANEWKKTFDWFYDRQGVGWAQANVNGLGHKDDVQALDDWTLEMNFSQPSPWGIDGFFIVNQCVQDVDEIMEHATDSDPYGERWCETNAVASGPYRVESRTPGEELVLKAREDWWEGKPAIDRVVLRVIPDASARYALLKRGEVDIASLIDWKDMGDLEQDANIVVERFKTNGFYYLGLHNDMPPGDDKNFRKAVACAIDFDEIVNTVLYGYGQRLKAPFGQFMKGYDPTTWPYEYDVEKAMEYLSESSVPEGCELDMYIAEFMGNDEKVAVMVKDYLEEIGVNVNIQFMTGVEHWDSMVAKTLPFFVTEWYSWVPDAGYHMLYLYQPDSFANFTNWQNAEAEPLMEQVVPMHPDNPERLELLRQIQTIMADDCAIYPLFATEHMYPHKPHIHGFAYYPDSNIRWERLWVE